MSLLQDRWRKCRFGKKVGLWNVPFEEEVSPEQAIVLGGICSLFTADSEALRQGEIRFRSSAEFSDWFSSWYPRIDQVHDTVGCPPRGTRRIIYVCEDSFFARRVSRWINVPTEELTAIFRDTHASQGHPVVLRWLRNWGYPGPISVVYTSDLEKELDLALRIWERALSFTFPQKHRDRGKVNLMYTGLWPDILGVQGPAIICEPIDHWVEVDFFKDLKAWMQTNPLGVGLNRNLGFVGYREFYSFSVDGGVGGPSRHFTADRVPNRATWETFVIPASAVYSYEMNFFGENGLSPEEIHRRIGLDIRTYYEG